MYDVCIIGGGAAGFYTAIHIAEANPKLKIAILERSKNVLAKVKVSGGGRCNVTHAEFDPGALVKNYPRGEKELLGPFHTYCTGDVVAFFEERGVDLKIEADGRMFPVSNTSQTIIDCFLNEVDRSEVEVIRQSPVQGIEPITLDNEAVWKIITTKNSYWSKKLVVATGSNPKMWEILRNLGHTIIPPVPSLFTFNCKDERISSIPGVSINVRVEVLDEKNVNSKMSKKSKIANRSLLTSEGPLLITHWGMSGPAILKLSAWGATILHQKNYRFFIRVNWLPDHDARSALELLVEIKEPHAKKTVLNTKAIDIPKRLWGKLVKAAGISEDIKWADTTKYQLQDLAVQLTSSIFKIDGKSTFKEEFVTAGGVALKEINFKTFESKIHSNLFFAGEVINIDAITGGFNFQNAWTGAYIAAKGITRT